MLTVRARQTELEKRLAELEAREAELNALIDSERAKLESIAGLSAENARQQLMDRMISQARLSAAAVAVSRCATSRKPRAGGGQRELGVVCPRVFQSGCFQEPLQDDFSPPPQRVHIPLEGVGQVQGILANALVEVFQVADLVNQRRAVPGFLVSVNLQHGYHAVGDVV